MSTQQRERRWVFDRPVYADGLFWSGVMLGVIGMFFKTTDARFSDMSLVEQALALGWRLLIGLFIVGLIGGAVRYFLRGYRDG